MRDGPAVACDRRTRYVAAHALVGGRSSLRRSAGLQLQFKQFDLTFQLFGLTTELHLTQFRDRQLQMFDVGYTRAELVLQFNDSLPVCMNRRRIRKHQRLQCVDVVERVTSGQILCDSFRLSAASGSSGFRQVSAADSTGRLAAS